MGFRVRIGAVAGALLVAMLADARNESVLRGPSSVAVHSDSSCCSVTRLEARLTSIERRLADTQRSIASLNDPPLIEYCTVDMAAYGYDDSKKAGYVKTSGGSSDEILTPAQIDRNRGVTLFELDPMTCTTKNRQRFDTYARPYQTLQLLETIESATTGTIIIGVTADTVEADKMHFQKSAVLLFTKYDMNVNGLQVRDKFVFIMQKGYPRKTVFQRKPRYGDSLRMKVAVRGSTVSRVTFSRV